MGAYLVQETIVILASGVTAGGLDGNVDGNSGRNLNCSDERRLEGNHG
jgi:hypothetical protein